MNFSRWYRNRGKSIYGFAPNIINISVNYAKIAENLNITSGIKEGDDIPSQNGFSGNGLDNCDIITSVSELSDLEAVIYGWCEESAKIKNK